MTFAALVLTALSFLQVVPNAIATFDGTFKTTNGKFVEVQVPSGDTMRMYVTRGTKFIRDGKPVKAAAFHEGDPVTVDAERDLRMNLLAVKIEAKPKIPDDKAK
jgi:hypothetical protein